MADLGQKQLLNMCIGGAVTDKFKFVYLFLDKFISTYLEVYYLKQTIVVHHIIDSFNIPRR